MPTRYSIFKPLTPQSRLREFFANSRVLIGAGPRPPLPLKTRLASVKYTDIPRGRVPGRGLLYSFLAHEFAIFLILSVSTAIQLTREYRRAQKIWRAPEKKLTYILPEVGGGSSGAKPDPAKPAEKASAGTKPKVESASASPEKPAPPAAAPSKPGLVYPASQPIVSNPPNPTNRIQTILQPELVKPPTLKVPLALPNMVMIARASEPRPAFAPRVTAAVAPSVTKTPSAPVLGPERHPLGWHFVNVQLTAPLPTAPQLTLPEITSHRFTPVPQNPATAVPKLAKSRAPATPEAAALKPELAENLAPSIPGVRERVTAVPRVSASARGSDRTPSPQSAELKPEIGGGTDAHSVLVLSPTPGAPALNPAIPPGEARGQFAMGPDSNLIAALGSGIGMGAPGGTGTAPAGGSTASSSPGGVAGGEGTGGGTSPAGVGTGEGKGSTTGTGSGKGSGTGESGAGSGVGIGSIQGGSGFGLGAGRATGTGSGTGAGTGAGSGTGAGTGPGTSPFSGITIEGGSGGGAALPRPRPTKTPPSPHGTYSMSIVATASSGGGLRDYGIFRNETAYTVYLDRSQAASPSWTLEYAEAVTPAPDPMLSSLTLSSSPDAEKQLAPPYPTDEEDPNFPPDVLARNSGGLVVITGFLTADGKFASLRIIQSPNPLLSASALEALSKWAFRPAERAGQPVRLKILLGIPLPSAAQ